MRDIFHADVAAGAAAIIDDERLAGRLFQRRGNKPCDDVGRPAGRVGDHEFDRTLRIIGIGRAHAKE